MGGGGGMGVGGREGTKYYPYFETCKGEKNLLNRWLVHGTFKGFSCQGVNVGFGGLSLNISNSLGSIVSLCFFHFFCTPDEKHQPDQTAFL